MPCQSYFSTKLSLRHFLIVISLKTRFHSYTTCCKFISKCNNMQSRKEQVRQCIFSWSCIRHSRFWGRNYQTQLPESRIRYASSTISTRVTTRPRPLNHQVLVHPPWLGQPPSWLWLTPSTPSLHVHLLVDIAKY